VTEVRRLEAVDLHACGEPGRVIVGGVDDVPAVEPTLTGRAWITGYARDVLDETEPFPEGCARGDIGSGAS